MLSKTFSQLSASFKVQAKALLGAGLLFLAACSPNNPLDSLENEPTPRSNQNPKVTSVTAEPASLTLGQSATVTLAASDPDGDALSYSWSARGGKISGYGNKATFLADYTAGTAYVTVEVKDDRGGSASGSVMIKIE